MVKKLIIAITIILILITGVFAVLWIKSPQGNYEPWIVLIGSVLIPIVAFWEKIKDLITHQQRTQNDHFNSNECERRVRYLEYIQNDINNKLNASIHNARFIDLGISDSPVSTHLPWVYKDSNKTLEFESINDAFNHYKGRMLLLGSPGSGKTTTMLHIAKKLTVNALKDENAPVPLIVNLSKFKFETNTSLFDFKHRKHKADPKYSKSTEIEQWIVSEFIRFPGITTTLASKWIVDGKIAVFFDGLDEVDDAHRARLVELLNTTFLSRYSNHTTLVCSRINEYLPFQEHKEKRLNLDGAVTLQPLNDTQIINYLAQTNSKGIIDTLLVDESIKEMARTPLILSMMSLAYGSAIPVELNSELSLTEKRHQLIGSYVAKMLQRKERRERHIPFDENEENNVPIHNYKYAPKKINQYLGWLAVRMSVRMQTAFPYSQLYNFLLQSIDRDTKSSIWWITGISKGLLLLLMYLFAILIFDYRFFSDAPFILIFGSVIIMGSVLFQWFKYGKSNEKTSVPFLSNPQDIIIALVVILMAAYITGLLSVTMSSILPGSNFLSVGVLFFSFIISLILFVILRVQNDEDDIYFQRGMILLTCLNTSSLVILFLDNMIPTDNPNFWHYTCFINVFCNLIIYSWLIWDGIKNNKPRDTYLIAVPLITLAILTGLISLGSIMIGENIETSIFVFFILLGLTFIGIYKFPLAAFLTIFLGLCVGSLLYGNQGSIIGMFIAAFSILILELLRDRDVRHNIKASKRTIAQQIEKWLEYSNVMESNYFLSPVSQKLLGMFRYQPLNTKSFHRYCENALLLKSSAKDFEFIHRIVRDYFSLRELQPNLHSDNLTLKIESIRSLGYQGDAGIDALIEFSVNANPDIRKAVQWAFGRIASPTVVDYIKLGLKDEVPMVRIEALKSSSHPNIRSIDYGKIITKMFNDPESEVQLATLEIVLSQPLFGILARDRLGQVIALMKKNKQASRYIEKRISENKKYDSKLVANCITVARKSKDNYFLPALIKSLNNSKLTKQSIETIAVIGDLSAVEALKQLLKHRDKEIRMLSAAAINKLTSKTI